MNSFFPYSKRVFLFVSLSIISSYFFTATAQNTIANSRVAVVASETKTNIWVSDFPKKTTVVITDNENNLLSIISTNDFGAVFLSLPASIKTGVIVKTLDGEIIVSNKAIIKNKQQEQNVVLSSNEDLNKA